MPQFHLLKSKKSYVRCISSLNIGLDSNRNDEDFISKNIYRRLSRSISIHPLNIVSIKNNNELNFLCKELPMLINRGFTVEQIYRNVLKPLSPSFSSLFNRFKRSNELISFSQMSLDVGDNCFYSLLYNENFEIICENVYHCRISAEQSIVVQKADSNIDIIKSIRDFNIDGSRFDFLNNVLLSKDVTLCNHNEGENVFEKSVYFRRSNFGDWSYVIEELNITNPMLLIFNKKYCGSSNKLELVNFTKEIGNQNFEELTTGMLVGEIKGVGFIKQPFKIPADVLDTIFSTNSNELVVGGNAQNIGNHQWVTGNNKYKNLNCIPGVNVNNGMFVNSGTPTVNSFGLTCPQFNLLQSSYDVYFGDHLQIKFDILTATEAQGGGNVNLEIKNIYNQTIATKPAFAIRGWGMNHLDCLNCLDTVVMTIDKSDVSWGPFTLTMTLTSESGDNVCVTHISTTFKVVVKQKVANNSGPKKPVDYPCCTQHNWHKYITGPKWDDWNYFWWNGLYLRYNIYFRRLNGSLIDFVAVGAKVQRVTLGGTEWYNCFLGADLYGGACYEWDGYCYPDGSTWASDGWTPGLHSVDANWIFPSYPNHKWIKKNNMFGWVRLVFANRYWDNHYIMPELCEKYYVPI